MVFKSTLALCPACSCHVRGESVCPHCGEALPSASRHTKQLRRSTAALAMGLAVAVSAPACTEDVVEDDQQGQVAGDDDDDSTSSSWGNSVVATYGVAPSSGTWDGFGGHDGVGGNSGVGGDGGYGGDDGMGGFGGGGDEDGAGGAS